MRGTEMNTNDSSINEDRENANNGFVESVRTEAFQMRQQQPPQEPVVQWDRFLPLRSLKVLLVENNDSTRQVVGALLQNCGYEVVAVTNGLEAWKILEDPMNHIDLVLTEVVMPCLSGVGLLSKIKRHKNSKHIPVIMMSSTDTMGTVIKCLSKGAVDFLVKPIRKNELKNLWQHVWRKSCSSKGVEGSGNKTSSNNENDNGRLGLIFKDESDKGSGTQSYGSKRLVEVEDTNEKVLKSVIEKERLELESEPMNEKRRKETADFTLNNVTNCTNHQMESVPNEVLNDLLSKIEDRGIVYVANELSSLELRLKRQRVEGDVTIGMQLQNILRHSGLSAFTRYNASITNQAQSRNKDEDDMDSTSAYMFTEPEAANNFPIPESTAKAYRPDTTKAVHQQVQVQHHHHYHHHHHHHHRHHHVDNGDLSNCRPSDVWTGPSEGKAANYTTYSLSGSINRSNGENGSSSSAAMAEGVAGHGGCGGDNGSGTGSRGGLDQNRLTQREAALYKFRQKKRDRCFDKKIKQVRLMRPHRQVGKQKPQNNRGFVLKVAFLGGSDNNDVKKSACMFAS